jgi:hypothetical protein
MRSERGDAIGLCARCRHAAAQRSAKGSEFWRCRLADEDAAFLRYPPLPVRDCRGFVEGAPSGDGSSPLRARLRRA